MAGDGKLDSNRMALADNEDPKSKRTNSGHVYNSVNSVNNASKLVDDPPHSPVFKANNIFKESAIDNFEKHEHISEVPTVDNMENPSMSEKLLKIDELKQKQRETRNRIEERRSRR